MLLLGFLLVIAASLTIWSALTLNDPRTLSLPGTDAELEPVATPSRPRPTNDEVRGARAHVTRREGTSRESPADDAFERFLTSDARRDESEF